jgi:Ribonuclease G/E
MSQKILIDGSSETQTQFALLSDNGLEDFEFESISKKNLKGNIYLGKYQESKLLYKPHSLILDLKKMAF